MSPDARRDECHAAVVLMVSPEYRKPAQAHRCRWQLVCGRVCSWL